MEHTKIVKSLKRTMQFQKLRNYSSELRFFNNWSKLNRFGHGGAIGNLEVLIIFKHDYLRISGLRSIKRNLGT